MTVPTLYMVLLTAENAGRHFNVFVFDDDHDRAVATAEEALRRDGWTDVTALKSGVVSEASLANRDQIVRDAAATARELGWSMIRYTSDS